VPVPLVSETPTRFPGQVFPTLSGVYDLGAPDRMWRYVYVSGGLLVNGVPVAGGGTDPRVDQLIIDVTALQGQVATLEGQVTTITGQITTINGHLATLDGDVTTLTSQVTTLNGQVTVLNGQIVTINGHLTTLDGQVTTLDGQVTVLDGQVTTLEGQVTTLNGQVAVLDEQTIPLLTGQVAVGRTGTEPLAVRTVFAAEAYGAVGDGVTDSTTAINAAIVAASAAGGGVVTFGPGTYMASQITLKSKVILDGGSVMAVTLKQIAGSNRDFITSQDFATLTGTSSASNVIPHFFGLRDIRIDGNKAGNTAGRGIAWYGNGMLMLGVVAVQNAAGHNIYTECGSTWAQSSPLIAEDMPESHFETVISLLPGDRGWYYKGSTDSQLQTYICIPDTSSGWGWYSDNSIDHVGIIHVYGPFSTSRQGIYVGAALHADVLMSDGLTIQVDGGIEVSDLVLTFCGLGGLGAAAAAITLNGPSRIDRVGINWDGGTTGVIAFLNTSTYSVIGAFGMSANSQAGNTGLKNTGSQFQVHGINIAGLTGAGSIAIDDRGGGFNIYEGMITDCKTGLAYTASQGYMQARLLVYTPTAGQVGVSGSPPQASDRFDVFELGVRTAQSDVCVVSSNAIAMDSTALQTITLAHRCLYAPSARNVQLTFTTPTVTDFVWAIPPYFVNADAVNIAVRCKLSTASATAGSRGDVVAHIRMGA
jgi:outer membrane murein-binding lipoprotein Lpp